MFYAEEVCKVFSSLKYVQTNAFYTDIQFTEKKGMMKDKRHRHIFLDFKRKHPLRQKLSCCDLWSLKHSSIMRIDLFETGRQNCYLKYQDMYPDVLSVFRIFISSRDIHAC